MNFFVDIIHVLLMSVQTGIQTGIAILSKTVSLDVTNCQEGSVRSVSVSVFGERRNTQRSIIAKILWLLWVEVCGDKCWRSVHIMQGGVMWQC